MKKLKRFLVEARYKDFRGDTRIVEQIVSAENASKAMQRMEWDVDCVAYVAIEFDQ